MRLPWPVLVLLPLVAAAPACTPPPTQELALADMVPRGDARAADAPLFTIYFDVASAALSTEAAEILDRLVADPARAGWTRITLAGHADRSGSVRLNRRLAGARVAAVREHLIRAGVPAAIIAVTVAGEQRARPGAEADDRRVEIFVTG